MDLNSWLTYLNNLPSGLANKSLDRVKSIAKKLDLLNFTSKIITVGGTNGKGSCTVFLESILLSAGYKTGAFISPHLLRYNERIRLNGKDIDDASLIQAFEVIYTTITGHNFNSVIASAVYEAIQVSMSLDCHGAKSVPRNDERPLSYFEFTLLVALYIFKQQGLGILILEVGLGGRFDAVNILDSDIAIITTISLDHTQILGNTKEAIGYEKAGIMRANKPIIFGDLDVPKVIYEQAEKSGAILYLKPRNDEIEFAMTNLKLPKANAETALIAIKLLQDNLGFNITQDAISTGLEQAFLPGRYQSFVFNNKEVILDVAHNAESAGLLAENLIKSKPKGRTIAVMSMLSDKDILRVMQVLNKTINKWYISALDTNRAASLSQLKQSLQMAKVENYIATTSIEASFKQALAECQIIDRIVVFGSFHTVAIILEIIKK